MQSDEELINQAAGFSCGCDKCLARVEPPRMELLSRLERGRKAIETLEKLNAAQKEYFDCPEMGKEVFVNTSLNIIREYQHE